MEDIPNYDSWKLNSGQDKAKKTYGICAYCEDPIEHGDEIKITKHGTVHAHCYGDMVEDYFNPRTDYAGE